MPSIISKSGTANDNTDNIIEKALSKMGPEERAIVEQEEDRWLDHMLDLIEIDKAVQHTTH